MTSVPRQTSAQVTETLRYFAVVTMSKQRRMASMRFGFSLHLMFGRLNEKRLLCFSLIYATG